MKGSALNCVWLGVVLSIWLTYYYVDSAMHSRAIAGVIGTGLSVGQMILTTYIEYQRKNAVCRSATECILEAVDGLENQRNEQMNRELLVAALRSLQLEYSGLKESVQVDALAIRVEAELKAIKQTNLNYSILNDDHRQEILSLLAKLIAEVD